MAERQDSETEIKTEDNIETITKLLKSLDSRLSTLEKKSGVSDPNQNNVSPSGAPPAFQPAQLTFNGSSKK